MYPNIWALEKAFFTLVSFSPLDSVFIDLEKVSARGAAVDKFYQYKANFCK